LRRGTTIRVEVVASDGDDDSEAVGSPELTIINTPPEIVAHQGSLSADGVFRTVIRATDRDRGDELNLQFHLENAPAGMSIDSRTGEIEWTPTPEQSGTTTFTAIADDLHGGRSSQEIEVRVSSSEAQPVASAR
jgi:hypothetical protein